MTTITAQPNMQHLSLKQVCAAMENGGYCENDFLCARFAHRYTSHKGEDVYAYAVAFKDDENQTDIGFVYIHHVNGGLYGEF
jgi:hypothetical protein